MNENSSGTSEKIKIDDMADYIAQTRRFDSTRKREVLTAKYLEENYNLEAIKSDNILKSTGRYLVKYYKPSGNCKFNL